MPPVDLLITACYEQDEMACHLHPILNLHSGCTCNQVTNFFQIRVQLGLKKRNIKKMLERFASSINSGGWLFVCVKLAGKAESHAYLVL